MTDILYIVVPCYNEEEVLPETARRLQEKMTALIKKEMVSPKSRVLFVDDGSKDSTWEKISSLHQENPLFSGLKLSHNRGHQNALIAGLMTAREPPVLNMASQVTSVCSFSASLHFHNKAIWARKAAQAAPYSHNVISVVLCAFYYRKTRFTFYTDIIWGDIR